MKSILIIEDNLEVRENIAEILVLSGYKTYVAKDGKEGIKLANEVHPDLILCDVMMPNLDGYGVLKIIRNHPHLNTIPFLFLTAKVDSIDFRKGMQLGADDYLTKPFDDVDLLSSIEMRLNKSDAKKSIDKEKISFFNEDIIANTLESIISDAEERVYPKKSTIIASGKKANWVYFIKDGLVKREVTSTYDRELITNLYSTGDWMEYQPLFFESNLQEQLISLQETRLSIIPTQVFKDKVYDNKLLLIHFSNKVVKENARYKEQLLHIAYSSVRKKVAFALLYMSEVIHSNEIFINRDDLAKLCGIAKETVIRTLSDFKSENIINIQRKVIVLLNKTALQKMPQ